MADEVVVTELTIDARGAEAGSAAYVRAMKAAQSAVDKVIEQENAATLAMEKQTIVMTKTAGSISATSRAWERLKASVDPAYRATKDMEAAMLAADAAARKLGVDGAEIARVMDLVRSKQAGAVGSMAAGATASKLAGYELRNLKFQLIDIAQSIPLAFQSPLYFLQNLGFQFAQIGQIFMGRGGFGAAISELGSMFGGLFSRFAKFGAVLAGVALGFNQIRDAASDAEKRQIGFGETFVATYQVIRDGLTNAFGPFVTTAINPILYAFQKLGSAAVDIAELVINSFHAAFTDIKTLWNTFPDIMGAAFVGAANIAIEALNGLVKKSSDAVDSIIAAFNRLTGQDVPLLNAKDQTVAPLDNQYLENLKKAVVDRNAAIEKIMKETPIRDFGQAVVDQIQTNHALEDIDTIANVDFGKSIGGANSFTSALGGVGQAANGVKVEFGGIQQEAVNVTRAFEDAKRSQLAGLEDVRTKLQGTQSDLKKVQAYLQAVDQTPVSDVFGKMFDGAGGQGAIANAVNTIDKVFTAFDEGRQTVGGVDQAIEMVRASLIAMGGDAQTVDAFINKIVHSQMAVRQLESNVDSLGQSIRNIPNRTVTVTVVTRQVGSGTQSVYDVPNGSGGTSGVGVTRYGGASTMTQSAYDVPRTAYGSQGGYGGGGTSTVGVTRFSSDRQISSTPIFNTSTGSYGYVQPNTYQDPHDYQAALAKSLYGFATGGVIHPGDSQQVSFFKSPQETVGIFTPQQMSALADPQSAVTVPTADQDKLVAAITDTATNTKKTAQILDDIKTTGSASIGGGSYSGSSSSSGSAADNSQSAAYAKALQTARSNFRAAGIVGAGSIGYGGQGLAATPEQIAHRAVYGFASGGMIGGDSRDTQEVKFFKRPREKVIIADDDQISDQRGSRSSSSGGDRPIEINMPIYMQAGAQVNKDSTAELRRQVANAVRDGLRSINGR
ncbi:hypothetical protein [Mesorhizobium sp. B263B2A]|uniref:hypothetical protein n=1 Tax=Mesorhizobium sp. B263B2A TaxID=2876669 RepID=UPI001CD1645B|nr:hypothetical protein [Mesorhizobium sp. B263B2A]MCA0032769.1 hypothetical protein [Mesorhizobium sp. B263B2A]